MRREAKTRSTKNGWHVNHGEMCVDVLDSTAFTVRLWPINPGLETNNGLFNWLPANGARAWDYYKIRKMTFKYQPTCGTLTGGEIFLAFDPVMSDAAPSSKFTMSNYRYFKACAPWEHASLTITPENKDWLAVRLGAVAVPQRLTDCGNFLIASVGGAGIGNAIGNIVVEYDIEFKDATVNRAPALTMGYCDIEGAAGGVIGAGFEVALGMVAPDPVNFPSSQPNNMNITFPSGSSLGLPFGRFRVSGFVGFTHTGPNAAGQYCRMRVYFDGAPLAGSEWYVNIQTGDTRSSYVIDCYIVNITPNVPVVVEFRLLNNTASNVTYQNGKFMIQSL